jgi:AraC-like DNA-binding protein
MPETETDIRHYEMRLPLPGWQEHQLRLVWGYVGRFPQGFRAGVQPTTPFRVWQVLSGRATVTYRQHTLVVKAGEVAFLPPSHLSLELERGTVLRSLALEEQALAGQGLLGAIPPVNLSPTAPLVKTIAGLITWAQRHGDAGASGHPTAFASLDAEAYGRYLALVWSLMGHLLSAAHTPTSRMPARPIDPRLHRLLGLIQAHAATRFPDKAALAGMLGLSWRRIEQLCRQHWDESPQQLHDRLRAREACHRLSHADVPIKLIAFDLGFPSAVRFCQWFTRQTHRSPRAFRKLEQLV